MRWEWIESSFLGSGGGGGGSSFLGSLADASTETAPSFGAQYSDGDGIPAAADVTGRGSAGNGGDPTSSGSNGSGGRVLIEVLE